MSGWREATNALFAGRYLHPIYFISLYVHINLFMCTLILQVQAVSYLSDQKHDLLLIDRCCVFGLMLVGWNGFVGDGVQRDDLMD